MSRHFTFTFLLIIAGFLVWSAPIQAQTPTAQQIEQFKKLPRAQQEQLARQMGIDISQLSGLTSTSADQQPYGSNQVGPYPRGTQFDQFGNPINGEEEKPELELDEEELKLYGSELFANAPSTFSPQTNVPVPANYVLGPGDEVNIQLFGKENEQHSLLVNRDGTILIPKLGPFNVATLTFSEMKKQLVEQIKRQVIGVDVSISMGQIRNMRIFVMGEAYKPGAYNVSSLSTITNALFVSGGVTDIASLRNIQLKREGKLITTLDLYDLLNQGDSSDDMQLQAGDVVFIPAVEKVVSVDGEVRRPAIYELKGEETLSEVIKLAGGKLAPGFGGAISIKRYIDGSQVQLTADLSDPEVFISNGDSITVPKISPLVTNSVTLIGAVARPGKYQWKSGMKLSDLIENPNQDLLEHADLSYVLVLRQLNSNRDISVYQTDFTLLLKGDKDHDVALQQDDRVLIFSKVESEVLGDVELDDLAYVQSQLKENEKLSWKKRIAEKQFWRSVGLDEPSDDSVNEEDDSNLQAYKLIDLTEAEKKRVLEFRDTTFYSRKRMLAPVLAKLKEQAKYGEPVQIVEVAGEVKVPGMYPLAINGELGGLIKAAGGLTESSYPLKSEITRTSISETGVAEIQHIAFSPKAILSNNNNGKFKIVSRDRVNIFSVPSWQEEFKVTVKGEVSFPGEYTIRRGEKLTDLLERVGGLTEYGDPAAAIFTRESLKEQERSNLRKLTEELRKQIASESLRRQSGAGAMVSYDEAKKLLRDLTKAKAVGRLVIDFNELVNGNSELNVALENGDVLYIPGKSQTVNVIGEVYVPTSHMFSDGLTYEDYVLKSGGYRSLADEGSTYIIRANGSVDVPGRDSGFWFSADKGDFGVRPGDTIVVPFDANSVDGMTLWANATQIIYQLAVAVAAIGSL